MADAHKLDMCEDEQFDYILCKLLDTILLVKKSNKIFIIEFKKRVITFL